MLVCKIDLVRNVRVFDRVFGAFLACVVACLCANGVLGFGTQAFCTPSKKQNQQEAQKVQVLHKNTQDFAPNLQKSQITSQKLSFLDNLQKITKTPILAIDEKSNIIEFDSAGRRVGESGFVWHSYDENYASIIASATIIEVESSAGDSSDSSTASKNGIARAKITPATLLEQRYLPSPTNKPVVGDEVHFGTLNSTAFIIAPTLETYDEIRASYPSMQFLNSDLMVGYLFDKSKFDPKPKEINKACAVYSVGLLFLVTRDRLSVLDCESLVVLDSADFDTSGAEKTIAPFFSRVQYAASGSLDSALKRKHSRQYFEYYEELLKEGKKFK